ncbi:hypothetical protein CORMATOL_01577 [Corynebacterium matruchotii ATCC 33806]|uniref:Uncharacterized protein n=1 Tax=Corynebacterium matruchotii ATCC 33806 TaxID=566549 RepID=C0E3L3_9CORY|nr:hypothetical protein CORMATOL_01577 [Corynebacterium matruchotii ATCC 33806]
MFCSNDVWFGGGKNKGASNGVSAKKSGNYQDCQAVTVKCY